MEMLFVIFLMLLFLVGFAFVLKDYYREKRDDELKNLSDEERKSLIQASMYKSPKFIATNRERIYIISIAVLGTLLLLFSLLSNVLIGRCSKLQNECINLKQELVQLEATNSNKVPAKSAYEEELEMTMDIIESLIEIYERFE